MATANEFVTVFTTEEDSLRVVNDPRGKILVYMTSAEEGAGDVFSISVSTASLQKLRDRATRNVFSWVIKDGSLEISGKNDSWDLTVQRQDNQQRSRVYLDREQTASLKDALFDGL